MRFLLAFLVLVALPLAGCVDEAPASDDSDLEPAPVPAVSFLPPVELECPDHTVAQVQDLVHGDCGAFGEPVLEVAGDGTIWYSATCCVGRSPPIWLSHDGGETFELLPLADGTGVVRDAFGIEGDFAIDDAGNVYFFDISAATSWFTKYEADGTHVHTKADAFEPLVDRPWVRAGVEDQVFILYNTGFSSIFLESRDGGLTWDRAGSTTFPCGLLSIAQGAERDTLAAAGCSGDPRLWLSHDGGATWDETRLPLPEGAYDQRRMDPLMQPAVDDAGVAYVSYTHATDAQADTTAVFVVAVHPDGQVEGPWRISGEGMAEKPWLVAGGEGEVALAWYGTDSAREDQDQAQWYLHVAASQDADTGDPEWDVRLGDPDPVLHGAFGRNLGDFLQVRHTPEGDLAIAYSVRDDEGLVNRFLRTEGVDLGPAVFLNGPQ